MATARVLGIVTAFLAAITFAPAAEAKRVALVIGNQTYQVGPLSNPVRDAEAVASALKRLGFDTVHLRRNLDAQGMKSALRDFGGEVQGAEIALVYYAGHGTENNGANFLIPVDARLSRAIDLDLEAIRLDTVLGTLEGATKLKVVILDACRNTLFPLAGGKRSQARGLARVEPEDNTLVAYAAKEGTVADDGTGRTNSPFTEALLRHIETPGLEVDYVFRLVRDDVVAATSRQQIPHVYGTQGRERVYFKAPAAVPAAAAPPAVAAAPGPAADAAELARLKAEIEELRKKQQSASEAPAKLETARPDSSTSWWPWSREPSKEDARPAEQAMLMPPKPPQWVPPKVESPRPEVLRPEMLRPDPPRPEVSMPEPTPIIVKPEPPTTMVVTHPFVGRWGESERDCDGNEPRARLLFRQGSVEFKEVDRASYFSNYFGAQRDQSTYSCVEVAIRTEGDAFKYISRCPDHHWGGDLTLLAKGNLLNATSMLDGSSLLLMRCGAPKTDAAELARVKSEFDDLRMRQTPPADASSTKANEDKSTAVGQQATIMPPRPQQWVPPKAGPPRPEASMPEPTPIIVKPEPPKPVVAAHPFVGRWVANKKDCAGSAHEAKLLFRHGSVDIEGDICVEVAIKATGKTFKYVARCQDYSSAGRELVLEAKSNVITGRFPGGRSMRLTRCGS